MKKGKLSIIVSMVLTACLFPALGFLAFWLPVLVPSLIDTTDNIGNRAEITEAGRVFVLIDAYVMLAVALVAVILLFCLLHTILRGKVFSGRVTGLLSAVSLCCFAEGVLFLLLVPYFQLAACGAIAVFFIAVCLRVVKNVIEEAGRIKSENDLTI